MFKCIVAVAASSSRPSLQLLPYMAGTMLVTETMIVAILLRKATISNNLQIFQSRCTFALVTFTASSRIWCYPPTAMQRGVGRLVTLKVMLTVLQLDTDRWYASLGQSLRPCHQCLLYTVCVCS
jgi:hypothetical protein